MLDLSRFEALTFDCYGTLIDWESGLLRALGSMGLLAASPADTLAAFARAEARAEAGPYRPYRQVLTEVALDLARELGRPLSPEAAGRLPASIADWEPFPDTAGALEHLARRFSLNVISNVDDDLFESTRARLGRPSLLERVVTAQYCRSYKPARRNFRVMLALLDLPPDRVLHVAQSLYHDIGPARELGLATVWVRRRSTRTGGGATMPAPQARPDLEVPDLATLAAMA